MTARQARSFLEEPGRSRGGRLSGIFFVVFAVFVGFGLVVVAPASARAAEPGANSEDPAPLDTPARASLTVDTSTIGAQSPVLLRRIEELGDIELRRAEILPNRSEADPEIVLALYPLDGGGYRIASHLAIAGEIVTNSAREVLCSLCTEGETVERARVEVDRLIPFIRDHARVQRAARTQPAPDPPETDDELKRSPVRLTTQGKVGVALVAVGAVGAGVGLGLALRKPTPDPRMPLNTLDTRLPGYVILGIGGAALLAGVTLVLNGRSREAEPRVTLLPHPRGLLLTGHF